MRQAAAMMPITKPLLTRRRFVCLLPAFCLLACLLGLPVYLCVFEVARAATILYPPPERRRGVVSELRGKVCGPECDSAANGLLLERVAVPDGRTVQMGGFMSVMAIAHVSSVHMSESSMESCILRQHQEKAMVVFADKLLALKYTVSARTITLSRRIEVLESHLAELRGECATCAHRNGYDALYRSTLRDCLDELSCLRDGIVVAGGRFGATTMNVQRLKVSAQRGRQHDGKQQPPCQNSTLTPTSTSASTDDSDDEGYWSRTTSLVMASSGEMEGGAPRPDPVISPASDPQTGRLISRGQMRYQWAMSLEWQQVSSKPWIGCMLFKEEGGGRRR